jgi:suppressor of G2 allele of SKP1
LFRYLAVVELVMPKDWSKIEKELLADEEDESKQSVDDFFKKIYSNATDEQKRAMMKSFQTSNGTVLSTNWDEVKDKQYDPTTKKPE